MKNTLKFAILTSTFFYISCSGNNSPESDPSIIPAKSNPPAVTMNPVDTTEPVMVNPASLNQPVINPAQTAPISKTINNNSVAGLNPAHGQPGHRCDIAVGAPLNSAPSANSTQPVIQTVANPAGKVVTAPDPINSGSTNPNAKLNPPHGQPGHDCSVQVGAPLKN